HIGILYLDFCNISDATPLVSGTIFSCGDILSIMYNPLDATSCSDPALGLPALTARGVVVNANCGGTLRR
ncbi:MAG: hypothetical protein JSV52_01050, partial [Candidatus Zixiibacteriota bacterium]